MVPSRSASAAGYCTSVELADAHTEVDAIDRLVRALPDDASAAPAVTERILGLFGSSCFGSGHLARDLDTAGLRAARARSIKRWWNDDDAERFFADSLDHATMIHFAPSIPPLLDADLLAQDDPLRAVLCPTFAVCDPAAEGLAMDVEREIQRVSLLRTSPPPTDTPTLQGCVDAVAKDPPNERMARYADCVHRLVPRNTPMPDAHFRSPKGWLVIRGRRGHYTFCDESRAYDLDTGSAFVASRCSGLVLVQGGSVDQDATHAGGTVKTQIGKVSPEALRRLALVLWIKGRLSDKGRPYAEFPVPVNIPPPDPTHTFGFGSSYGGWRTSAQTHLEFRFEDGHRTLFAGSFLWPNAWEAADQAADDLVLSAEATLEEGCPRVALPATLFPAGSLGGVSSIDATPDALQKTAAELAAAFAKLRKASPCKKK